MSAMMAPDPVTEAVQLAGVILAAVAGAGIFVLIWKAAWMIRDIKAMSEATGAKVDRVLEWLGDHEARIRVVEKDHPSRVIYDGPERRTTLKEDHDE